MAIDWARLKLDIIDAAVRAVNGALNEGLIKAEKDVPVRKVFTGGRQTVRFKTAQEIEKDKDLRSRLGLGPEILATPEATAFVRRKGFDPKRANSSLGPARQGPVLPRSRADRGRRLPRLEAGLARTIEFPARGSSRDKSGRTRAQRGLTEVRRNRANDLSSFAGGARVVDPTDHPSGRHRLKNPEAEFGLSGQGRRELKSGRAFTRRKWPTDAEVNARTGEVVRYTDFEFSKTETLGGGLRNTLRVNRASPDSFPDIEGWLVAGDAEHDYAKYQELGTRHHAAHPFLRPRLAEWKLSFPAHLMRSLGRTGR